MNSIASNVRDRWPLVEARAIAERVFDQLSPFCERKLIVGSVRRERSEVHDVEMCLIPRFEDIASDLFGSAVKRSMLDEPIATLGEFKKNGPRMKQVLLPEGIYLELYIVLPPAEWGAIATLRTGPGDFSTWLVTKRQHGGAMPSYLVEKDGALWRGKEKIETPEEADFFRVLGLDWIEPRLRARPSGPVLSLK